MQVQISPMPLAASCASQPKRTGRRQNITSNLKYPPDPVRSILEVLRLGLGADLSLDCRHQLRQSWSSDILEPFLLRAEAKHSLRWLQTGLQKERERERTHAVSDICAVVYMVLVKCVWMPTPSCSCRLWNATKSRDVPKSFLGALQCFVILFFFLFIF